MRFLMLLGFLSGALTRAGMATGGFYLMYRESLVRSDPGEWFVVGTVLIVLAVIPWRTKEMY